MAGYKKTREDDLRRVAQDIVPEFILSVGHNDFKLICGDGNYLSVRDDVKIIIVYGNLYRTAMRIADDYRKFGLGEFAVRTF